MLENSNAGCFERNFGSMKFMGFDLIFQNFKTWWSAYLSVA